MVGYIKNLRLLGIPSFYLLLSSWLDHPLGLNSFSIEFEGLYTFYLIFYNYILFDFVVEWYVYSPILCGPRQMRSTYLYTWPIKGKP